MIPPPVALFLWFVLLLALLALDPAKTARTSPAVWLPVIWMFILGSRLPSQWFGGQVSVAAEALEEGNPVDRTILLVLIVLALAILVARAFPWGSFLARNLALMAFLGFALVSVCWSDFAFVAFKRWIRDLGNYLVILVALSDPRPMEAVGTVFRRLSYLLIPLSVVLIKYYSNLGLHYSPWSGQKEFVGVATSKNTLGVMCLVCGLFFFWDTVSRWGQRKQRRAKRIILLNAALLAMTLWLLYLSNSATSRICLLLGCVIIAVAQTQWVKRRPLVLKVTIPVCFFIYLIVAFGFDLNGQLAGAVGRDPTLTDRTKIWAGVLSMHTNPILGTGYESFWLGPRLQKLWLMPGLGHINEAHNGYLEVYLNQGIAGVLFLVGLLIASYRTIWKRLSAGSSLASLMLAVWAIVIFYDMTEAGFRSGLLFMTLLMGAMPAARRAARRAPSPALWDADPAPQVPAPLFETTSQRR